MIRAKYTDKKHIVNILIDSFENNKSVNYIVSQDMKRMQRIKALMTYSFEVCYHFGDIFLTKDKKGCALIVLPDKKKTTLRSILLDVNLIISAIGLSNIKKAIKRESIINKFHPDKPFYYLWYIGIEPTEQNKGIGSKLLKEVIEYSKTIERPIYLETSTLQNIPWYNKFGFKIYNQLDFGYQLFFMKRE